MRIILTLTTLILSACVTNQEFASQTPTIVLSPPNTSNPTYYQSQGYTSHVTTVKADQAWDYIRTNITTNEPGSGVKVLIMDSGIQLNQAAVSGKVNNVIIPVAVSGNTVFGSLATTTPFAGKTSTESAIIVTASTHGTGVAATIVGNKNTDYPTYGVTSGIAFASTLDIIQLAQNDGVGNNLNGLTPVLSNSAYLANLIQNNGYKAVNMSFSDNANPAYSEMIQNAISNNNVLIAAATGNNPYSNGTRAFNVDYTQPTYPAAYAATINGSSNTGIFLAVTGDTIILGSGTGTSVRPANQPNINYCGAAALYCLAAPNTNVLTASSSSTNTNFYLVQSGTSFATPIVVGAAAVMSSTFPMLTMKNIGTFILRGAVPMYHSSETVLSQHRRTQGQMGVLTSAGVTSGYGQVSSVYGYGELDLLKSVQLVNATTVAGTTSDVGSSIIYTSAAFAQNLQASTAMDNVTTYDEYGSYTLSLKNNIKTTPSIDLSSQISALVMHSAMQGSVTQLGSFGYISSMNLMPQQHRFQSGLSFTNDEINAQLQRFGINPSLGSMNFGQSNIMINKQIGGVSFSFQENYRPYNENLGQGFNNFEPYLLSAFSNANAKQVQLSSNFGKFSIGIQSTFGESKTLTSTNGDTLTPSNNMSSNVTLNFHQNKELISIQSGILQESRTLLGAYSSGALSLGQNNSTVFSKIRVLKNLFGGTNFIGAFSFGRTTSGSMAQSSLFSEISPIYSRSFVIGINQNIGSSKDSIELTYSQPLAITSGSATFNGYSGHQNISFSSQFIEQDFGISFQKSSQNAQASFQALYIKHRNNMNVPDTFGVFGRLGWRF